MDKMTDYISFEDYSEKYHSTGILLSGKYHKKPAKVLNDNQLKTYYNTHLRKLEKMEYEKTTSPSDMTKDQIIRQECMKRDRKRCRLMSIITQNEMRELINNSIPLLLHKIDTAHVFGKNAYPKMRYVLDNVVLLNRVSHNWLDEQKSPVSGKPVTADMKQEWWQRIVGKKIYSRLLEMSKEDRGMTKVEKIESFDEDIICSRDESGIHTNVPQRIVYHSPTGFEWGYGGSGPSDLALNILSIFLGSEEAWKYHQDFKWKFIANMPSEGGTISRAEIMKWIEENCNG